MCFGSRILRGLDALAPHSSQRFSQCLDITLPIPTDIGPSCPGCCATGPPAASAGLSSGPPWPQGYRRTEEPVCGLPVSPASAPSRSPDAQNRAHNACYAPGPEQPSAKKEVSHQTEYIPSALGAAVFHRPAPLFPSAFEYRPPQQRSSPGQILGTWLDLRPHGSSPLQPRIEPNHYPTKDQEN